MSKRAKSVTEASKDIIVSPKSTIADAFKPPKKKSQECPILTPTPATTVSTADKDTPPSLELVIARLDVIQECIDYLASVILTREESRKDMDEDESKEQ